MNIISVTINKENE